MSELSSPPAGPLLRMFAQPRKAFSISELASVGPLSRSMLYRAIHDGSLVARKIGDRTIVLAADWDSFLQSLPKVGVRGYVRGTARPSRRAQGRANAQHDVSIRHRKRRASSAPLLDDLIERPSLLELTARPGARTGKLCPPTPNLAKSSPILSRSRKTRCRRRRLNGIDTNTFGGAQT